MNADGKFTFRLGSLQKPLEDWCNEHGTTPSKATRAALSLMLGVSEPEMDGHIKAIQAYNAKRKALSVSQVAVERLASNATPE